MKKTPMEIRADFTKDLNRAKDKFGHGFNTYLHHCCGISTGYVTSLLDPESSKKKASLKTIQKLRPFIDQINNNMLVEPEMTTDSEDDIVKDKLIKSLELIIEARDAEIKALKDKINVLETQAGPDQLPTGTLRK